MLFEDGDDLMRKISARLGLAEVTAKSMASKLFRRFMLRYSGRHGGGWGWLTQHVDHLNQFKSDRQGMKTKDG